MAGTDAVTGASPPPASTDADGAARPEGRDAVPADLRARLSRAWRRHGDLLTRLFPYMSSALLTLAVALWTFQPWRVTGTIASVTGDPLAFHAWVQAILEDGWYETAGRLSAPYEMNSHTYTVTDELLFAVVGKVLAPLAGSAAGGVTLWVVLCFPLAAVFAVAAARTLGVGPLAAVVPGVAFPLLPDHWIRATGHFSLSSTWAIPLGLLIGATLLRPPEDRRRRLLVHAAALLGCVAISLTNAYYATFAALVVGVLAVGGAVARRSWSTLGAGLLRATMLIVPVVLAMALDRRYVPEPAGYPSFETTRNVSDAETYGGKIVAMLLPGFMHRFASFRELRSEYDAVFPDPAEYPSLGIVASVGFLGLVVWAVLAGFRRRPETADPRLRVLSGLLWVSVLAYVVGGLGTAWALLLDGGGIRVWSRMHVVIGLLALVAVAVAVERVRPLLARAGVVGLVVLVVLVDQTTPLARPDPHSAHALRTEVTALTTAIAEREGDDAMIYQAPFVTFPVHQIALEPQHIYDGFLPYLYSTTTDLRWSFGGLQGDPASDWNLGVAARPVAEAAPMLEAAGFAGLLLDRIALASLPDLEGQLRATLGEPVLVSSSGRWQFFDLHEPSGACRAEPVQDELAALAVAPPLLYPGENMNTRPGMFGNDAGTAELRVVTQRDDGWDHVEVSFALENPGTPLRATFPDGSVRGLAAGSQTVTWSGPVEAEETPIVLERVDGDAAYVVRDLRASATPSPAVASCLGLP